MRSLIIGLGEVGRALEVVLIEPGGYDVTGIDKGDKQGGTFEILHICFPYSDAFVGQVLEYQKTYLPKVTVIHSTVPVGTSRRCGAVHSPIRGLHPDLEEGIRTFVKLIGGPQASEVADYFRRAGLRVMLFDAAETTELAKLLETESYRANIEFCQRAKALADQHGLSFHEVYTLQAMTYNEGYLALGRPEYLRPILQPISGPIGGHCVMANKELISEPQPRPRSS